MAARIRISRVNQPARPFRSVVAPTDGSICRRDVSHCIQAGRFAFDRTGFSACVAATSGRRVDARVRRLLVRLVRTIFGWSTE